MKTITPLLLIFMLCINSSHAQQSLSEFDFMIGKWKRENKKQYEVWEKGEDGQIKGYAYKIIDGEKKTTETLILKQVDDQIILEPTVPNQNKGKAIQFVLNTAIKDRFSFENPDHDFPKKIQYQKIDSQSIKVMVSGDDGSGFSYIQNKLNY